MDKTNFALGNDRRVNVCEWKGEKRVDLWEWTPDKPTKKGISLTLNRWKNFVDVLENIDQALQVSVSLGWQRLLYSKGREPLTID